MSVTPVTQVKKQPRPVEYDVAEDEKVYTIRRPSSARKYHQPIEQDVIDGLSGQQVPVIPRRRASGGLKAATGVVPHSNKITAPPLTEKLQSQKHFPLMAVLLGMGV